MEHMDGKLDRDGHRIENESLGPKNGPPDQCDIERAGIMAYAAATGDWDAYYILCDTAQLGRGRTRD